MLSLFPYVILLCSIQLSLLNKADAMPSISRRSIACLPSQTGPEADILDTYLETLRAKGRSMTYEDAVAVSEHVTTFTAKVLQLANETFQRHGRPGRGLSSGHNTMPSA